MSKPVKGFLAPDGKFFEYKSDCDRYTYEQEIIGLCESHSIHPENFMALLNSWHEPIRGYYDADSKCASKQANGAKPAFEQSELPPDQDDQADTQVRDRDTPGFLQFTFGGDQ